MNQQRRADLWWLAMASLAGLALLRHAAGGVPTMAHAVASFAVRFSMALLALTAHEWAHGYAAWRLGDATARDAGRLTLNPLAHISVMGLLVVPGVLTLLGSPVALGWARPVPVDFARLVHPRRSMALIAAAGPVCSIGIAVLGSMLLRMVGITGTENPATSAAWTFVVINFALGVFNLLPLFPMDGGRIVASAAPGWLFRCLCQHEAEAALATVGCLVLLPWMAAAFGWRLPGLEHAVAAFLRAVTLLTHSPDAAWAAPLQAWMTPPA